QTAGELSKRLLEFVPGFSIPEIPTDDKVDKKKILKTVLAVSVPLIAVLIVLAVVFLRPSTEDIKDYNEIPDLSGMTLSEAQKTVDKMKKELGISFTISEKNPVESNIEEDSGKVAMQSPKAGSKISSEDVSNGNGIVIAVNLYEYNEDADSSDDRKIEMPALEGKTLQKAEKLLKDNGLNNYVVEQEYDETVEEGKVIEQSVKKGSSIKANTEIVIRVSKGPKPTTTKATTTRPSTTKPAATKSTTNPTTNAANGAAFNDITEPKKPSTTKPPVTTTKPTTTKNNFDDLGGDGAVMFEDIF
ncbi:MAG: PASTA domain-containing protein, partial [Acutalibacteraceae bacterium]